MDIKKEKMPLSLSSEWDDMLTAYRLLKGGTGELMEVKKGDANIKCVVPIKKRTKRLIISERAIHGAAGVVR